MRLIDLSHPFTARMPVFPGDPPASIENVADFASGGSCVLHKVSAGLHTGTHIDAPRHMIPGGSSIGELPLEQFTGRGVLIDARGVSEIGEGFAETAAIRDGDVVLIWTGWSARFREPVYFHGYPTLTAGFASFLADAGVKMVGLDTPSPDCEPHPIHRILLSSGVPILENLTNLETLAPVETFRVTAFPLGIEAEAAWTRAVAWIE